MDRVGKAIVLMPLCSLAGLIQKFNQRIKPSHQSPHFLYQSPPMLLCFCTGLWALHEIPLPLSLYFFCDPSPNWITIINFLWDNWALVCSTGILFFISIFNSIPSPLPTPFPYPFNSFNYFGWGRKSLLSFQNIIPHLPHLLSLDIKINWLPCSLWRHHSSVCHT